MAQKLMDSVVKALLSSVRGNKVYYDTEVRGFGCRVTASGARSFILNYRTRSGRERRITIGQYPNWKTTAARAEASELKKRIDRGEDPLADIRADRIAPTIVDLCARYQEEHLPKKRPSSQRDDRSMIEREIMPVLKHRKVAEVTFSDIDELHRGITKRGRAQRANRVVALLSKMFNLSIKWGWRTDNPTKGIERNPEVKRERYLSGEELAALMEVLAAYPDQQAANIIRFLLLTGARRGEVMAARWEQFDLERGIWTKPGTTTKQKTSHRVPLSAPARQLLSEMKAQADSSSEFVFPGRFGGPRENMKGAWDRICSLAGINDARMHDLRHTYASLLASSGLSLPVIGALLGHTQPQTTARYAHLLDDPLREATERVGALVSGQPSADVVPLQRKKG